MIRLPSVVVTTFQFSSCYLVALTAFLRMTMVINPTGFSAFHKKIARPLCIMIWVLLAMVLAPFTVYFNRYIIGDDYISTVLVYFRCHIGVTVPIVLSVLVNIYLSFHLKMSKPPSNNLARNDQNNKASFQKLTNGLVIWLIVCNAPFVAWVHYSLYSYRVNRTPWIGIEGVLKIHK